MTVRDLYEALSVRIPATLSEEWDNDGLMCCPDPDREVKKALFALDVTDAVVAHAVKVGVDVIVSHHPLIFAPLHAVTPDDAMANRVLTLVRAGIAVFSFHTRFDRVQGGVNDVLARKLRLADVVPLGEGEATIGRIGTLPEEMPLEEFAEYVKVALGAPAVQALDADRAVFRVAIVGGEGKDFISAAIAAGADTYLSGRLGYHAMQDAPINLIEAGHYYTERASTEALSVLVKEIDSGVDFEIYTPNPLTFY